MESRKEQRIFIFRRESPGLNVWRHPRRYFHSSGLGRECYLEKDDFIYDKVFIYADERSNLSEFFSFIETDMEAIDRGGNAYEIIQKGYSKGTACDMILKKFGLELDQAYVFGDSMNDLSMFQYAAHTIAMGNHAKRSGTFLRST